MIDCLTDSMVIKISELSEQIESKYSPNSAKYYKVMLNRLKQFNRSDDLSVDCIDKDYIEQFSDFLTRSGLTPSTVRQMLKFFRAILKPFVEEEKQKELRKLFETVHTKENPWVNNMSVEEFYKVVDAKKLPAPLGKIRLLFLLSFFLGGKNLQDMKSLNLIDLATEIPQIGKISKQFLEFYDISIGKYLQTMTVDDYNQGLGVLSAYLDIDHKLTDTSAADAWITIAIRHGITPDIIAGAIPEQHPYSQQIHQRKQLTAADFNSAYKKIAELIWDLKDRWFAMRCLRETPEEINSKLFDLLPLGEDEMFQVFIVPPVPEKIRKVIGSSPIEKILFFHTNSTIASIVKINSPKDTYVFSSSIDKKPIVIPDSEMHTFMLLCRLSPDTIHSYFPDKDNNKEEIPLGTEVLITDGQFSGQVGIVKKISDDRYTVSLVIHTLGNLHITADIPTPFLHFQ